MDLKDFERNDFEIYLENNVSKISSPPALKKVKKKKKYEYKELNTLFETYLKVNIFKLIDAIHHSGYLKNTRHTFMMDAVSSINKGRLDIIHYIFNIHNDTTYSYETQQSILGVKNRNNVNTTVVNPLKFVTASDIYSAKNELYHWYANKIIYTEMNQINKGLTYFNKIRMSINYKYSRIESDFTYETDLFDIFNSDGVGYDAEDSFIFKSVDLYKGG